MDDSFLALETRLFSLGFKCRVGVYVYELRLQHRIMSAYLWPRGPNQLWSPNVSTFFATVDELELAVIYQVLRDDIRDHGVNTSYLRRVLHDMPFLIRPYEHEGRGGVSRGEDPT